MNSHFSLKRIQGATIVWMWEGGLTSGVGGSQEERAASPS